MTAPSTLPFYGCSARNSHDQLPIRYGKCSEELIRTMVIETEVLLRTKRGWDVLFWNQRRRRGQEGYYHIYFRGGCWLEDVLDHIFLLVKRSKHVDPESTSQACLSSFVRVWSSGQQNTRPLSLQPLILFESTPLPLSLVILSRHRELVTLQKHRCELFPSFITEYSV